LGRVDGRGRIFGRNSPVSALPWQRKPNGVGCRSLASYGVARSALIETLQEARDYYLDRFVGVRHITVKGRQVAIVFERAITHLYSESVDTFDGVPPNEKIMRNLPGGRVELRRFNADRARLLDQVLPTLANYCRSVPGTGARGHDNRLVFGWPMPDGRSLCVALSPWRNERMKWTCVSAYPVPPSKLAEVRRIKTAPFPPGEIG
jgi:hypothetical protein